MIIVFFDKEIHLWEIIGFFVIYIIYVLVCFFILIFILKIVIIFRKQSSDVYEDMVGLLVNVLGLGGIDPFGF